MLWGVLLCVRFTHDLYLSYSSNRYSWKMVSSLQHSRFFKKNRSTCELVLLGKYVSEGNWETTMDFPKPSKTENALWDFTAIPLPPPPSNKPAHDVPQLKDMLDLGTRVIRSRSSCHFKASFFFGFRRKRLHNLTFLKRWWVGQLATAYRDGGGESCIVLSS